MNVTGNDRKTGTGRGGYGGGGGLWRGTTGLVLLGFLVVAGFFLLAEHRAHVLGILPLLLLLLLCPLLHVFMHGGHGGGTGEEAGPKPHEHGSKGEPT